MKKDIIYTSKAPEPIGPYSQAIILNIGTEKLLYTSGQIAIDSAKGEFKNGDIKEQTLLVMQNLKAILNEANTDFNKVIKTTVFIKNMNDFSSMNEVYSEYFNESKPARSTIEAARLPKDALVEIELIAII
ncbi:MAG: RidA family protein [Ignavibacteria bacterium]|nr:RidA family protein [Ignavibacteria bacterium]